MADYQTLARQARIRVLSMVHKAGTSHIASNYSVIDIATVLYENLKPGDEVVWSKGWSAAAIYYFLAQQGKIPKEDLDKFPNPPYLGLAETSVPGVLVSGGSMGHGLPIAVGMALGKKRAGEDGVIYCIMSDGEMNEGTTWESAMVAAHHQLDNLRVIIDKNKWQAMGRTKEILDLGELYKKWKAFGWSGANIDGHDYQEIEEALQKEADKPFVIIADTTKGKGVSFFEDHLLYHYKHVDDLEFERAMRELQ